MRVPRSQTARMRVQGDWACFTNIALKAERTTYPVITPSAGKGVYRAVYGKPEFEWEILRILVCKPLRMENFGRSELNVKTPIDVGTSDQRTIRSTLALRYVDYVIEAALVVNPLRREIRDRNAKSYYEEAIRRMELGECFRQPCLGQQGMFASWRLLREDEVVTPIPLTLPLGSLLFDLVPKDVHANTYTPVFWDATLVKGVLDVPESLYEQHREQMFKARHQAHLVTRRGVLE